MQEPIRSECLVTKITNDSVHFILVGLSCPATRHLLVIPMGGIQLGPVLLLSLATLTCVPILVLCELALSRPATPVHLNMDPGA